MERVLLLLSHDCVKGYSSEGIDPRISMSLLVQAVGFSYIIQRRGEWGARGSPFLSVLLPLLRSIPGAGAGADAGAGAGWCNQASVVSSVPIIHVDHHLI